METAPGATGVGMQTCAGDSRTFLTWLLNPVKCDFFFFFPQCCHFSTRTLSSYQGVASFPAPSFSPLYSLPHSCSCRCCCPAWIASHSCLCTLSNNSPCVVCKHSLGIYGIQRSVRPRHFPQGVENLLRMKRNKCITDN